METLESPRGTRSLSSYKIESHGSKSPLHCHENVIKIVLKDSNNANKIAIFICEFSVIVNVKHQNYGNSDRLQSLTGYFANGVVLMVDWTIPQCDEIPQKNLINPKL